MCTDAGGHAQVDRGAGAKLQGRLEQLDPQRVDLQVEETAAAQEGYGEVEGVLTAGEAEIEERFAVQERQLEEGRQDDILAARIRPPRRAAGARLNPALIRVALMSSEGPSPNSPAGMFLRSSSTNCRSSMKRTGVSGSRSTVTSIFLPASLAKAKRTKSTSTTCSSSMRKSVRLPSILAVAGVVGPVGGRSTICSKRPWTSNLEAVPLRSAWKVTIPSSRSFTSGVQSRVAISLSFWAGGTAGRHLFVELQLWRAGAHRQGLEQVGQAQRAEELGGIFDIIEEVAWVENVAGGIAQVTCQRA